MLKGAEAGDEAIFTYATQHLVLKNKEDLSEGQKLGRPMREKEWDQLGT